MTLQQRYAMQYGELIIANLNLVHQVEELKKELGDLKELMDKVKDDDAYRRCL